MHNLLKFNENKTTKTTIITFIIDYINQMFESFNTEKLMNNKDIQNFIIVLESEEYLRNMELKTTSKLSGIYDEIDDEEGDGEGKEDGSGKENTDDDGINLSSKSEELLDDLGELEGLGQDGDGEGEIDYEGNFDRSGNYESNL